MALFVFASSVKSLVLVFAAVTTVASIGSSEKQSRSFRYVVCTIVHCTYNIHTTYRMGENYFSCLVLNATIFLQEITPLGSANVGNGETPPP